MQAQTVTPSKIYITKDVNNINNYSTKKALRYSDFLYRQNRLSKTELSIYGSEYLVYLLEIYTAKGVLQVYLKKGVKKHS